MGENIHRCLLLVHRNLITIQLSDFLSAIQVTIQLTDHSAIEHIFPIRIPDVSGNQMPTVLNKLFIFPLNWFRYVSSKPISLSFWYLLIQHTKFFISWRQSLNNFKRWIRLRTDLETAAVSCSPVGYRVGGVGLGSGTMGNPGLAWVGAYKM